MKTQAMNVYAATLLATLACLGAACSTPPTQDASGDVTGTGDVAVADLAFGNKSDGSVADVQDDTLDAGTDAAAPDGAAADISPDAGDAGKKGGFDYECKPLAVESCVTACGSAGTRKCLKEWGPCIPPAEFCGNCADDNCDGLINEGCAPNPACTAPVVKCPIAILAVAEGQKAGTQAVLHLSAAGSYGQGTAKVVKWLWSVQAPLGASGQFLPSADVQTPTYQVTAAGQYLFHLDIWDGTGTQSCVPALFTVTVAQDPPVNPEVGCADGTREGFLDDKAYPQIAGCSGAWDQPGITPDSVVPTCGNKGGNSGSKADGIGCAAPDLCAASWHVCKTWQEVAAKSATGCVDATPANAAPKSLFFAIRQPSQNGSVCGDWADGPNFNDLFGCGNLGTTLDATKKCGPLDRVIASTAPNKCGFNEAEPSLGPWECVGPGQSDLNEGANVTKKACQGGSCQYDGQPVNPWGKGGVLCCGP